MIMAVMWARAASFVVWALVGSGAVYWGLKVFARPQPAPPQARVAAAESAPPALAGTDLTRLLGADPVVAATPVPQAPAAAARFQLLGVIARRGDTSARQAVALIAVDGKPPRAYRVGSAVAGDTVLRAVHARGADLGAAQGPVQISLQLPAAATSGMAAPPAPGFPAPARPAAAPAAPPAPATTGGFPVPTLPSSNQPPAPRVFRPPQVMPVPVQPAPQPAAEAAMPNADAAAAGIPATAIRRQPSGEATR